MNKRIEKIISCHWEQMIDQSYFYRGMSLKDLDLESPVVMDLSRNPASNMIPLLMEYSEFLLYLIENGLEFQVNDFYVEPLQKILQWTIRDIKNPGIDFTTSYTDAVAYAFNYAGSQVKHNFNIIANTIHECEGQSCFNEENKKRLHMMNDQVKKLLKIEGNVEHQSVVVKVKRSCKAFQNKLVENLNFGSYDFFFERLVKEAKLNDALSVEKIAFFLHQKSQIETFNVRLTSSLFKRDIQEIIRL